VLVAQVERHTPGGPRVKRSWDPLGLPDGGPRTAQLPLLLVCPTPYLVRGVCVRACVHMCGVSCTQVRAWDD